MLRKIPDRFSVDFKEPIIHSMLPPVLHHGLLRNLAQDRLINSYHCIRVFRMGITESHITAGDGFANYKEGQDYSIHYTAKGITPAHEAPVNVVLTQFYKVDSQGVLQPDRVSGSISDINGETSAGMPILITCDHHGQVISAESQTGAESFMLDYAGEEPVLIVAEKGNPRQYPIKEIPEAYRVGVRNVLMTLANLMPDVRREMAEKTLALRDVGLFELDGVALSEVARSRLQATLATAQQGTAPTVA